MIKRTFYLKLILFFFVVNVDAELSGDPGEIIAVSAVDDNKENAFIFKVNDLFYELIPLPFNNQGEFIRHGDTNIYVNKKDFGESRITIANTSMVDLNKEDSDRVFKESKIIQEALNTYSKETKPNFDFMKPVEGIISSRYGKKRFINNKPRSPHLSLDVAAPEGTKVVAPSKGKIILVGNFFYAGNYIVIDHGYGLLTSYSHLSKINIENNQIIKKGEKIGEIGSTGRVTGPHLHWTVYFEKVRINPELILQEYFLEKLLLNQT
tara:strand:+ start:2283 stop:3077 length:795 start_codon:yes stop_codon:yes gene_type:complete